MQWWQCQHISTKQRDAHWCEQQTWPASKSCSLSVITLQVTGSQIAEANWPIPSTDSWHAWVPNRSAHFKYDCLGFVLALLNAETLITNSVVVYASFIVCWQLHWIMGYSDERHSSRRQFTTCTSTWVQPVPLQPLSVSALGFSYLGLPRNVTVAAPDWTLYSCSLSRGQAEKLGDGNRRQESSVDCGGCRVSHQLTVEGIG